MEKRKPVTTNEYKFSPKTKNFLDLLQGPDFSLNTNNVRIINPGQPFIITDKQGNQRAVDYAACMPNCLFDALRSTEIPVEQLPHLLGDTQVVDGSGLSSELMGSHDAPAYSFDDGRFKLTVFHGNNCDPAQQISCLNEQDGRIAQSSSLAAEAKAKLRESIRATIQLNMFGILKPVALAPLDPSRQLFTQEDVAASLESLLAELAIAQEILGFNPKNIRIDLLGSTSHGILLGQKMAHDNDIKIEFNVGYAVPGLSATNYLLNASGKEAFGDVGNHGASLPRERDNIVPFNSQRDKDDHGSRGAHTINKPFMVGDRLVVARLLRGGLFIGAVYDLLEQSGLMPQPIKPDSDLWQIYMSRTNDREFGDIVAAYWEPMKVEDILKQQHQ